MKGTAEASAPDQTAWRKAGFNDGGWELMPAPFYYGETLTGTPLDDMRNNYTCVFLRKTFVISNPDAISELTLQSLSDDGFIAWINGNEVARYNMPEGEISYNGNSSPALAEPIPWETYAISGLSEFLVAGTNVLAVQAFNSSLGSSSDFVFDATLAGTVDVVQPSIAEIIPADQALVRALTVIEVIFNEAVTNVDAADLLINGAPAASVERFSPTQFVFTFPEPAKGPVNVTFAANHGITDLAASPNSFGGASWTYTLNPDAPLPGVLLNEFMTDNDQTLNDDDGDSSDWIELYNSSTNTVDLGGWFLSANSNNLAQWKFPNVTLGANGYLVVFASEKNRTNPGAKLHTNFKLPKSGGYVALSGPRTNVVSVIESYPPQQEDVSYGRERSNPSLLAYFPTPTPGAPNSSGGPGFAPDVEFSPNGGTFIGSMTLRLNTAVPEAVIRYNIGTNLPTESSQIYSGPITLTNTTQVRARAFQTGLLPGRPRSETYLALANTVVNFRSDLPIIVLHNHGGGAVSATTTKFVMMQVFEPKGGWASMTNGPDLSARGMFRLRGSSTQGYAKGSYALETIDEFGDDRKHSVLGMPEESDWVFYAPNNFEPVLIHNPFMHQLSRDVGRYSPRTRFAEVYLVTSSATGAVQQVNYNGIYVVEEKIKRGKDRVDVDKLEPEHLTPPNVTGGYMLKIDRSDPGDYSFGVGSDGINYVEPKRAEIRPQQQSYIEGHLREFYNNLVSANFADPVNGYAKYVDGPSWIDHHVLNVLAFNVDALRLSTYFYKPRNGKVTYGPLWDFDRALGSTDGRDSNPKVWAGSGGTDFFYHGWWARIFRDLEFWQNWIDRYHELRRSHFATTNLYRLTDQLANEVRKAQPREQSKWGIAPRGGSYQSEVNLMKTWLSNRVSFIDSQLVRAPLIGQRGGLVARGSTITITGAPNVTVYYTLDGSDPRLRGGQINPQAQVYTSPISIDRNTHLVARGYNAAHVNATGSLSAPQVSKWSGWDAATFWVELPPLVITEIMYNPAPPPPGTVSTNEMYEFIELKNRGATTLSLNGIKFTNGVSYTFGPTSTVTTLAAGERVVLVKNKTAFTSRYGSNIKVAGEYIGSLDNGGERLTLVGPMGEPMHDFEYDNAWHPFSDELGFSLVVVDENAPLENWPSPAQWRLGGRLQGTPGAAEPAANLISKVLVNEALTHTDLPAVDTIELFNAGAERADVSGWYLSDDFSKPKKYRLGATFMEPGAYLLLDESDFNTGANSFSLGSQGDEVYLFSADAAGNLTGYAHGFEFGPGANGVTFGRHVTSDQREVFVAQSAPTLGRVNGNPKVGPVVINEIMFCPPLIGTNDNTLEEYIEIRNVSAQSVDLFDPGAATNTWRLRGGSDFNFPRGVTLAPGELALVVNFDPAAPLAPAGYFRTKYSVPAGVRLFGPYEGKLSNSGERLSLQRPDAPEATDPTNVPYIVVDEVTYSAANPWPAEANGSGKSLQRRSGRFADDPVSWVVANAGAGQGTIENDNPDRDGDGLPNDWELAHGLDPDSASGTNGAGGDQDADGMSNLQEYQAGTDPRNGQSLLGFAGITRRVGSIALSFQVVQGRTYTVLYRSDLASGNWIKLADIPAQAASGIYEQLDGSAGEQARFYRLQVNR